MLRILQPEFHVGPQIAPLRVQGAAAVLDRLQLQSELGEEEE
jgi:hypothetical protein